MRTSGWCHWRRFRLRAAGGRLGRRAWAVDHAAPGLGRSSGRSPRRQGSLRPSRRSSRTTGAGGRCPRSDPSGCEPLQPRPPHRRPGRVACPGGRVMTRRLRTVASGHRNIAAARAAAAGVDPRLRRSPGLRLPPRPLACRAHQPDPVGVRLAGPTSSCSPASSRPGRHHRPC